MHAITMYKNFKTVYAKKSILRIIQSSRFFHEGVATGKLQGETLTDWELVVKDAERVVGYPTSFLNLRWLLNDEVANVALHMRKLIGTKHPLPKTAKNLFLNNDKPAWGLIVLLVSKAGGLSRDVADGERDITAGILHNQRMLAEVTEMIYTTNKIHNVIMEFNPASDNAVTLSYGNNIALLSGDYLLSKSLKDLALMRNHTTLDIISSAVRDLSEYEFLGKRNKSGIPYPYPPARIKQVTKIQDEDEIDFGPYDPAAVSGNPKEEWILRNLLLGASMLGKSCRASMVLSGLDESVQKQAYLFGKHLALAMLARYDYEYFASKKPLNLVGAPVLMHLCEDPELYNTILLVENDATDCDFVEIKERVRKGNGLKMTRELHRMYAERAYKNLSSFENSDAKTALEKVIEVMC